MLVELDVFQNFGFRRISDMIFPHIPFCSNSMFLQKSEYSKLSLWHTPKGVLNIKGQKFYRGMTTTASLYG